MTGWQGEKCSSMAADKGILFGTMFVEKIGSIFYFVHQSAAKLGYDMIQRNKGNKAAR